MWLEFCLKQFHQVRLSIKLSMIWFASNYSFFINRRELKISPKISISFEHAKCSWKLNQWYCGNFDAIHSFFLLEQQIEKKNPYCSAQEFPISSFNPHFRHDDFLRNLCFRFNRFPILLVSFNRWEILGSIVVVRKVIL